MISSAPLPPTQTKDEIISAHCCRRLATLSIRENFGMEANDWQIGVGGAHIQENKMTSPGSDIIDPAPIFLCQPTGGGKSLVRDGFATAQGGITWSISPLQSALGADQEAKINEKAIQGPNQVIKAIHLDNYWKPEEQKGIAERLSKLGKDSRVTIIILSFASSHSRLDDVPQYVQVSMHWKPARSGSLL
jgi:hypothetical protein